MSFDIVLNVILYAFFGFFLIKIIFFELPFVLEANSWPNYFKKVFISCLIIGSLFALSWGFKENIAITLVILLTVIWAAFFFFPRAKESDD